MFVVVGSEPVMEARLITRVGENQWTDEVLFETLVPPLANAPEPSRFVF
jgi:protein-L-isoaspartate(D-aspartate) O-methyltransferase